MGRSLGRFEWNRVRRADRHGEWAEWRPFLAADGSADLRDLDSLRRLLDGRDVPGRRPADHKRFIVLPSVVALPAATFRILVRLFGFAPWVAIAGCLATLAFVLTAMVHECRRVHSVSPAYVLGASTVSALMVGAFLICSVICRCASLHHVRSIDAHCI